MSAQAPLKIEAPIRLPSYHSILVAADSSNHANSAVTEAAALASHWDAQVTGTHVYAAKMHDMRFRQMEGGLPEQFREERELERQRDVHDDLITRGLSIITDSYLDQAERLCTQKAVRFARCSLEGKNYRELVRETNSKRYDLLVMGALGVGAIAGGRLGTVCERVTRRADIDTLVVKDPERALAEGPIVVAVDGSRRAYGGLLTALSLASVWDVPVEVVAAFDPYYHYVAFNRIAGVLSEEAGKVFRFKDQERLHEEIIDSGLARIYQGHLAVAESMAADFGMQVQTRLLDGKPHDAIAKYVRKARPSLLVIGKLGIHADPELDIGGNAENLLRNVDCAVLLSQRHYQPRIDVLADVTTSWTSEARRRMDKVPTFVRDMARMAILRYAQERGHTVITERIVEEATAKLMPSHAEQAMAEIVAAHDTGQPSMDEVLRWSDDAKALLLTVEDPSVRDNSSMRAEKKARAEGATVVTAQHLSAFIDDGRPQDDEAAPRELHWHAAALARLMRVPEGFMRDASRERIEQYAQTQGISEIDMEVAEQGLAQARKAMESAMKNSPPSNVAGNVDINTGQSKCPFADLGASDSAADPSEPEWTSEAQARLQAVPEGFCRDMTRKAAVTLAAQRGLAKVDAAFVDQVFETFEAGAQRATETLPWDEAARARIDRAPETVRGMLVQEIEGWAGRNGRARVTHEAVNAVKNEWQHGGVFHLDPDDPRREA